MAGTFDPLADIIDLRDVVEVAESQNTVECAESGDTNALDFLMAYFSDAGYGDLTPDDLIPAARELADNEPTVIARRYFVEYAQELADDIGATNRTSDGGMPPWPLYCIDWEAAARDLEQDYSSFTFDGCEYLIRSF